MHTVYLLMLKASWASLFGILLLLAMVVSYYWQWPILGLYRYDALLIYALLVQLLMLKYRLETPREALVILVFHILAMIMELVLTHPQVGSWHYNEPAYTKLLTVPLFAGFMYSAVGSFLARSLRLMHISIQRLPPMTWLISLALIAYVNFMSKIIWYDLRWALFAVSFILFWRTVVLLQLGQRVVRMPFLLIMSVLAVLVWIAENIATYVNIWRYPNQLDTWQWVSAAKIGSWYLLLLLSLSLVLWIMGHRNRQGEWRLHQTDH